MRIEVQFHEDIEPLLAAWRSALSPDPDRRKELGGVLLQAFRAAVQETDGAPPHAIKDDRTDPPLYWAELSGGVWLGFVVRDVRKGFFGRATREVVVTQLSSRPLG